MSFSQDTKNEVLANIDFKSNLKPLVLGVLLSSNEVSEENYFCLIHDSDSIYILLVKIFKKWEENFSEKQILINEEYKIGNKTYFKLKIDKNLIKKHINSNFFENSAKQNYSFVVQSAEDKKMFCKGAYLSSATSSIKISTSPESKTTSGYHLEFDSKNYEFLQELSSALAEFNILPKIIKRKNLYVLYIKDAEQVSDTLALVGAYNSVIILQNEIVKREFRNKINRQTNCESGNISKLVGASIKQIEAIEKINSTIGLSSLDPELEEVALLRLANPEESLSDMLKLSTLTLTKSGLNHRLKKIISIADNLTWFN